MPSPCSRGTRPASSSDDLPTPELPCKSKIGGRPGSLTCLNSSLIVWSRPKKTSASRAVNQVRWRNGLSGRSCSGSGGRPKRGLPAASGRLQSAASSAPARSRSSQGKPRSSAGAPADAASAMRSRLKKLACGAAPRGLEGGGDGCAGGQLGVEGDREFPRDLIVDRPRRGDDGRHAGLQQTGDLGPRRAAVEEDQFQVASLAQERGQALGVRNPSPCSGRLEQEPVLPGMTAVMKDRHPIAMLGEDLEDLLETGVGPDDQLAQALSFGRLQDGLKQPQLLPQVAEIAMPLQVIGECQDDHRQVWHPLLPRYVPHASRESCPTSSPVLGPSTERGEFAHSPVSVGVLATIRKRGITPVKSRT